VLSEAVELERTLVAVVGTVLQVLAVDPLVEPSFEALVARLALGPSVARNRLLAAVELLP
jgi:hypothetical protein